MQICKQSYCSAAHTELNYAYVACALCIANLSIDILPVNRDEITLYYFLCVSRLYGFKCLCNWNVSRARILSGRKTMSLHKIVSDWMLGDGCSLLPGQCRPLFSAVSQSIWFSTWFVMYLIRVALDLYYFRVNAYWQIPHMANIQMSVDVTWLVTTGQIKFATGKLCSPCDSANAHKHSWLIFRIDSHVHSHLESGELQTLQIVCYNSIELPA